MMRLCGHARRMTRGRCVRQTSGTWPPHHSPGSELKDSTSLRVVALDVFYCRYQVMKHDAVMVSSGWYDPRQVLRAHIVTTMHRDFRAANETRLIGALACVHVEQARQSSSWEGADGWWEQDKVHGNLFRPGWKRRWYNICWHSKLEGN